MGGGIHIAGASSHTPPTVQLKRTHKASHFIRVCKDKEFTGTLSKP